jgi:hypothetical protein
MVLEAQGGAAEKSPCAGRRPAPLPHPTRPPVAPVAPAHPPSTPRPRPPHPAPAPAPAPAQVATERSQRFLGRDLEVLVEGVNPRNPGQAFGRIRHNKLAYFDGDGEALRGQLVTVRIEQANAYSLFGTMVGAVAPRDPLDAAFARARQQLVGAT